MEKALSVGLAGIQLILAFEFAVAGMLFPLLLLVSLGLLAVWFSAEVGSFVGPYGKKWLKSAFPTHRVRFASWAALLILPIVLLVTPYLF